MWRDWREVVIEHFPPAPGLPTDTTNTTDATDFLKNVDDRYASDAYNSLSIEGYDVTDELIDRVARGNWNPDNDEQHKKIAIRWPPEATTRRLVRLSKPLHEYLKVRGLAMPFGLTTNFGTPLYLVAPLARVSCRHIRSLATAADPSSFVIHHTRHCRVTPFSIASMSYGS